MSLIYRWCEKSDVPAAVELCNNNGFTRRSVQDWHESNIHAILAFDDSRIVGIIPFYRRKIVCANGDIANCGHLTAVVVEDEYRNNGIGSEMLSYLPELSDTDGFFVNSTIEHSAYRWYLRNGFNSIAALNFFTYSGILGNYCPTSNKIKIVEATQMAREEYNEMLTSFFRHFKGKGGYELRHQDFLNERTHWYYYKDQVKLVSICLDDLSAYMIAGIFERNSFRSIDILESSFSNISECEILLSGVRLLADTHSIKLVRFPLQTVSERTTIIKKLGFQESSPFMMLYKGINRYAIHFEPYEYHHFDYA